MKIFAPHEVLNIIIDKYINEVIPEYYMNLFNRFYIEFKSASFWISILYNKSDGFIINILKNLLLAPVWRLIKVIIACLMKIFYSFYFIFVNFLFDLIIKYVDIYARKIRVFYDKTLIEEINEVRRIILFINVKENFKKIFKPTKDKIVGGFVFKEEKHTRYKRIFFDVLLFFIWHMPLILGFISYLVRVFLALIWGYFLIVFFYFAEKIIRVFKRFFFWVLIKYTKVYKIKFKRILGKRYRAMFKLKRQLILKTNRLSFFLYMLIEKLYDNISIWFILKNVILRKLKSKIKLFRDIISLVKNGNIRFFKYKLYRLKYNNLLMKASEISIKENIFINIFAHVKKNVDDHFINRLEPLNHNISNMDSYLSKRELSKFNILRFGSILQKLNKESILAMVHKFVVTYNLDNYNIKKMRFKYKYKYIKRLKKKKNRFFLLIYWELIFPINYFFYCIAVRVLFIIYIVLCFFLYIIRCILFLLLCLLKFIFYILVIIFAGKEK